MLHLLVYLMTAIYTWMPPHSVRFEHEEVEIGSAIVIASDYDENDALLLASLAYYEGSYRIHALGKLGEIGPWQLRPPPAGRSVPSGLVAQAKEALYRWNLLGPCGYTGEGSKGPSNGVKGCPLAEHRLKRATDWRATHPYEEEKSEVRAPQAGGAPPAVGLERGEEARSGRKKRG